MVNMGTDTEKSGLLDKLGADQIVAYLAGKYATHPKLGDLFNTAANILAEEKGATLVSAANPELAHKEKSSNVPIPCTILINTKLAQEFESTDFVGKPFGKPSLEDSEYMSDRKQLTEYGKRNTSYSDIYPRYITQMDSVDRFTIFSAIGLNERNYTKMIGKEPRLNRPYEQKMKVNVSVDDLFAQLMSGNPIFSAASQELAFLLIDKAIEPNKHLIDQQLKKRLPFMNFNFYALSKESDRKGISSVASELMNAMGNSGDKKSLNANNGHVLWGGQLSEPMAISVANIASVQISEALAGKRYDRTTYLLQSDWGNSGVDGLGPYYDLLTTQLASMVLAPILLHKHNMPAIKAAGFLPTMTTTPGYEQKYTFATNSEVTSLKGSLAKHILLPQTPRDALAQNIYSVLTNFKNKDWVRSHEDFIKSLVQIQ
jgi:hypothetical protein